VVVVVPSFTEGEQGEEGVVAAVVARGIGARAPEVGKRVDGEGDVVEEEEADQPAADGRPPAQRGDGNAEGQRRHEVPAIEPAQLGEARQVLHPGERRRLPAGGEEPAHMAPEEAAPRGVRVARAVGEAVVLAMVAGPPEHALLHGALGAHGQDELEGAARPEGAVGEVAVVAGGDEEHAGCVADGG